MKRVGALIVTLVAGIAIGFFVRAVTTTSRTPITRSSTTTSAAQATRGASSTSLVVRLGGQHAGGCLYPSMVRDTYTLIDDNGSHSTLAVAQRTEWSGCQLKIWFPISRSYGFFDVLDYSATERCGLTAWGPFDSRQLKRHALALGRDANLNQSAC